MVGGDVYRLATKGCRGGVIAVVVCEFSNGRVVVSDALANRRSKF